MLDNMYSIPHTTVYHKGLPVETVSTSIRAPGVTPVIRTPDNVNGAPSPLFRDLSYPRYSIPAIPQVFLLS